MPTRLNSAKLEVSEGTTACCDMGFSSAVDLTQPGGGVKPRWRYGDITTFVSNMQYTRFDCPPTGLRRRSLGPGTLTHNRCADQIRVACLLRMD